MTIDSYPGYDLLCSLLLCATCFFFWEGGQIEEHRGESTPFKQAKGAARQGQGVGGGVMMVVRVKGPPAVTELELGAVGAGCACVGATRHAHGGRGREWRQGAGRHAGHTSGFLYDAG